MPDADIVVMEDLRYALGRDTDLGGDFLAMHPVGVHLEDAFYQSRSVGDFVRDRDALLLKAPADGAAVAVEVSGKLIDAGTHAVTLGDLPDFVV